MLKLCLYLLNSLGFTWISYKICVLSSTLFMFLEIMLSIKPRQVVMHALIVK